MPDDKGGCPLQGNETAAISSEQLLAAAKKAGRLLPTPTVDVQASNDSSASFPWQGAAGRKMLAGGRFVDICIPVVFHGACGLHQPGAAGRRVALLWNCRQSFESMLAALCMHQCMKQSIGYTRDF
jgi:hypothetical protein